MTFFIQPLNGIFKPRNYSYQLQDAEGFKRYKRYIGVCFLTSLLVFAIAAVFGIGTGSLSKELPSVSSAELETKKQLFLIGRMLLGILTATILLFISSLFYWLFVNVPYRKLVIIQMTVFFVYLLEKMVQIPLFILLDVNTISNIFSLGIIAQYFTQKEWLIHILGQITIFQAGMIFLTYYYIAFLSDQNRKLIAAVIISLYMIYWALTGIMSFVKVSIFF